MSFQSAHLKQAQHLLPYGTAFPHHIIWQEKRELADNSLSVCNRCLATLNAFSI
jgi:hypothetical protein